MKRYTSAEIEALIARPIFVLCNDYVVNHFVEALTHIDKTVVDKVLKTTAIFSANTVSWKGREGLTCFGYEWFDRRPLILIHEKPIGREPDASTAHAILHEFAHIWLDHKGDNHISSKEYDKQEEDSEKQLDEWAAEAKAANDNWLSDILLRHRNRDVNV